MLDSFTRIATLLVIPDAVVNLILLPIGTSLPKTVEGVIAAKQEKSSAMAI
jgi:Ca2+/Na+ antiporter